MRLFLSLRPSPEALAHLRRQIEGDAGRWHVTLVFLGEVEDPEPLVGPLRAVAARSPAPVLRLAGSGAFGEHGPVWVGVAGDVAVLHRLAADLAGACRAGGVALEDRPYRPHLTVGRRGRPDPASLAGYEGPSWRASEVELVRSRLGPRPAHEVLRRLPLHDARPRTATPRRRGAGS